jgi:DNA polymerase III alpha subunit
LSSIKQVGETSTDQIIEERNKNGQYFSLDEFLERHTFKGSKVNKRVIENLILSGAFDDVEAVQFPSDRLGLITQYRKRNNVIQDEEKDVLSSPNTNKSWWWNYQQKLLSGIAFFDYEELCVEVNKPYFDPDTFNDEDSLKSNCVIAGYVVECNIRESKKGRMAKIILENNYSMMNVLIWAEQFDRYQEQIENCDKTIMIISGVIQFDGRNNCNTLQTTGDTYLNCLK